MNPTTKFCPRCKQTKRTSDFGLNRAQSDGLSYYCFACKREKDVAVNAKRRDKIRAWERDHTRPCVDCGYPVSDGYRKGSRQTVRCEPCNKKHRRTVAVKRCREMLTLRNQGLMNYEIAERLGVSELVVATQLSRARLGTYGLLAERTPSPYWTRNK